MKDKIIQLMIIMLLLISSITLINNTLVKAEENSVTYYSIKDWTDKVNYVSGEYVGTHFENTVDYIDDSGNTPERVTFNINLFGDNSFPYKNPSINRLTSDSEIYTVSTAATNGQYRYFLVHFYENIKITELEYKIKITGSDGTKKNKEVLINPTITNAGSGSFSISGGTRVNTSFSEEKVLVNCNDMEANTIVIKAINPTSDDKIEFSHFQINKYKVYIHNHWSITEPQYETITKTYTYNDAEGTWSSDGGTENTDWLKSSVSSFYASVEGNYSYKPSIESWKWVDWNWKDDGSIRAWDFNAFKNYRYAVDINGDTSTGWYKLNADSGKSGYYSAGIFNYDTNTGSGTEYALLPSYWDTHNNYGGAKSYDNGWCKWAGAGRAVCYRHDNAQSSDSRKNMFGVFKRTISNVVPVNNQTVKYIDYYICDINGSNCKFNKRVYGNNTRYDLLINNLSGSYKLKARIVDNSDLTTDVYRYSYIINLDNEIPKIDYLYDETNKGLNNWYNKIEVKITPNDYHSGINKWRYSISKDSGDNYGDWCDWITSEYKNILLNETANYKIKTEVFDNVGNQNLVYSDVKKVDATNPYVKFSPPGEGRTFYSKLSVSINPEDDDSGIQKWRYSISTDEGTTFTNTSDWFYDDNPMNVILSEEGNNQIKVEAFDNAMNYVEVYSEKYQVFKSTVKIENMITYSYDYGKPQTVFANIKFDNCDSGDFIEIKFFVNNNIVESINKKYDGIEDYQFTYVPDKHFLSNLKIEAIINPGEYETKNTMKMIAYELTGESKESDSNSVYFEGITASSKSFYANQIDYKEYLSVEINEFKNEYYSGQPLENEIVVNYVNECENISDYSCQVGTEFKTESSYAIYDNGAEPNKDNYFEGIYYEVPLSYNKLLNVYLLPEVYADKYTGYIYSESNKGLITSDKLLYAGRKWYTDPLLEKGIYNYSYNCNSCGVNNFKWKLNEDYIILDSYTGLYRIRFVNPENPFPNRESNMWKDSKDWFSNLIN